MVENKEIVFSKKYIFSRVNKGAVTPMMSVASASISSRLIRMPCLGNNLINDFIWNYSSCTIDSKNCTEFIYFKVILNFRY